MFGWLFPRPPLDALEKAWVETRLLALARRFGLARMLDASVVLPTLDFLGGKWDGTPEDVRQLMQRLMDHLRVDTPGLELEICGDDHMCCAAGNCAAGIIRVAQQQLNDPDAVVATLAHELAYSLLPAEVRLGRNTRESEWLTDLLPVFLGLGIFMANAVIRESSDQEGQARLRLLRRQGFLPARMVGYAMALFTWVRGETDPPWQTALRLDALAAYAGGLRYLERTSDSVFTYERASLPDHPSPTAQLLQQLASGSPSARVATLWELREPRHGAQAAHAVVKCLHDRRPAIRQEAAQTLGYYGEHARQAIAPLIDLLHDVQYSVRSSAATALGVLGHDIDTVLPQLAELLRDPDREVVSSAATALRNFGAQGLAAAPVVLSALKAALIRCDHALIDVLSHTLFAMDPDPTDRIMQFFADDYELREQLVHIMVDAVQPLDEDTLG
jgi:hypothetical protein